MKRAPTSDWRDASRTYRALHRFVPNGIWRAARVGARGQHRFTSIGDIGAIVAANHFSAGDPFIVSSCSPRPIGWLGKREVFSNAAQRWFFDAVGTIPVDRARGGNDAAVAAAESAIARRRLVGIFPEGTRSRFGHLLAPHTGIARIALRTGCPIVPVGVLTDRFWPKGRTLPAWGEPVWVLVGDPIRVGRDPEAASDRVQAKKLAEEVMTRISDLLTVCASARERGERWERPE